MFSNLKLYGAIATTVFAVTSISSAVTDDFESQTVGLFPTGWFDVGQYPISTSAPNPSAVVIQTTNAFGAPTKAVSTVAAIAYSQGIYQPLPTSTIDFDLSADIRVDHFSTDSTYPASDWAQGVAVISTNDFPGTDFSFLYQVLVYASSLDQGWRLFVATPNTFTDIALNSSITVSNWYRVDLHVEGNTGFLFTSIKDIASGAPVASYGITMPGWVAGVDSRFQYAAFYDGELTATDPNLAVVDNTFVIPEASSPILIAAGIATVALVFRRRRR